MELEVLRFSSQKDSTNGLLFNISDNKRQFICYTLEDEHRDKKVKHDTRIPSGTYAIKLRTWGGINSKYSRRFADFHIGMVVIQMKIRPVAYLSEILRKVISIFLTDLSGSQSKLISNFTNKLQQHCLEKKK